ncbi:hypothetical protein FGG78_27740 [Thioclava sp. BHET1]|nr:hypothetical protein FGG78_27740 [Thioclava sp. BHET1]
MTEIAEYERRISRALERLRDGMDRFQRLAGAPSAEEDAAQPVLIAELEAALAAERETSAKLGAALELAQAHDGEVLPEIEARLDALSSRIDSQALELQRLKMANIQLRETAQTLREAMEKGLSDPALVNRSLQAELEGLRAIRAAEIAELDAVLGELAPMIVENKDA